MSIVTRRLAIWAVTALQVCYILIMGYGLGWKMTPRASPRSLNQPKFVTQRVASFGAWLVIKGALLVSQPTPPKSAETLMGSTMRTWTIRYGFI